jgi:hypothetical protein
LFLLLKLFLVNNQDYSIHDKDHYEREQNSNAHVLQMAEDSKNTKQPYHNNDHYNYIKNVFDGALHGNISIH